MTTQISVLMPTRGRPEMVRESLTSLIERCSDPLLWNMEVLVALDPDDPSVSATREVIKSLGVSTLTITVRERMGYHRLNEYFNLLAKQALGKWLLLWNDDAVMTTHGWDLGITRLPEQVIVADLWCPPHSPSLCTFPAVRKWAVDELGHFSRHTPHCDTYWQDMARSIPGGIVHVMEAVVRHERHDITGREMDLTRLEALRGYRQSEFYSPPVQEAIGRDAARLAQAHAVRLARLGIGTARSG